MSDLLREVTLFDGEGVPTKHYEVVATGNVCCSDRLSRNPPPKHLWKAYAAAVAAIDAARPKPAPTPKALYDAEIGRAYREHWPSSHATTSTE